MILIMLDARNDRLALTLGRTDDEDIGNGANSCDEMDMSNEKISGCGFSESKESIVEQGALYSRRSYRLELNEGTWQ